MFFFEKNEMWSGFEALSFCFEKHKKIFQDLTPFSSNSDRRSNKGRRTIY